MKRHVVLVAIPWTIPPVHGEHIDLDAAAHNVCAVRGLIGKGRKLFAVVKADGYGYGASEMGAVFLRNGADSLAVADLSEGVRLRQNGIRAPILVYPNSLPEAAAETLAHGLIPALVDLDAARAYSRVATGPCEIFVKVDIGLERLGIPAEHAVKTILIRICARSARCWRRLACRNSDRENVRQRIRENSPQPPVPSLSRRPTYPPPQGLITGHAREQMTGNKMNTIT